MGSAAGSIENVARVIQLAVAPIFLLTTVATTIMVLAGRLARIVDRGRLLEERAGARPGGRGELLLLERRAHLVYRAITLSVLAAILVCLLMTAAFLGEILGFNAGRPVALLFIAALFSYTGALMTFLREVFLAIANFRLGLRPAGSSNPQ